MHSSGFDPKHQKKEKKKGRDEGGREREGYSHIPESFPVTSLER